MNKFETLARMMMIPGNIERWTAYLHENFEPINEKPMDEIIKYIEMERGLIGQEDVWSDDRKLKQLSTAIKTKLK